MTRSIGRRVVALASVLAASVALVVPATSSAALPGTDVSSVTWNVRSSWVNYLTNPAWFLWLGQGSVTPTGGAAPASGSAYTSWGSGWTEYAYSYAFAASDDNPASPRTVALTGGLDFDQSAHGIDVSLSDLRVVADGGGERLLADASYVPLGGSTVTRSDIVLGEVVDVSGGPANQVQLTSAGAEVFNGGSNGSYRAGAEFGTLVY